MNGGKWKGYLLGGAVLFEFFLVIRGNCSLAGISDAFALSGICLLIAGLFQTAKSLHFYDLIIYGFQKFVNIWKNRDFTQRSSQGYYEFLQGRNYKKGFKECYITAGAMILCCVVLCFWL